MNTLPMERQVQILSALVEGNSVRSTSRMTGAHIVTILSLLTRIGDGCERLMDRTMRDLRCEQLQLDELWGYVQCKQKWAAQFPERRNEIGDFYCFVALDAETKLVPCYRVGKRTWNECNACTNLDRCVCGLLWRDFPCVRPCGRLRANSESLRV